MKLFIVFFMLSHLAFGYSHHHKKHHHRRGLVRKSRKFLEKAHHVSFVKSETPIPNSFELSSSTPEDQGDCGDCWNFALTGALRDSMKSDRLSFMYLLNCATDMYGCNGGDFDAAAHMVSPSGPPAWGFEPYTGIQSTCKIGPVNTSAVSFHMLGGSHGPSFKDIAYVVSILKRPLAIDIAADNNFEDYDGGIFNACSSQRVDHMVMITGYDCEGACNFDSNGNLPHGVGFYKVKNSWSPQWGEQGYVRIKATDSNGHRCNAVAAEALYYDVPNGLTMPSRPWYCLFGILCSAH